MELNKETQCQWEEKKGRVTDLLKKINHAVKSSQHFRFSLSSLINSNVAPSDGNDKAVSDHRGKMISISSSKRGDGGSSSQGDGSSKTLHSSSTTLTMAPYHDGYLWRKYGEKKINNTRFPRSYYRCTYHVELNCNATKQVQQCTTDDDSPMYKVTYFHEHTCNDISSRNTNATNNYRQIMDFTVKETSLEQQLTSSSDMVFQSFVSSMNSQQMSDQGWIKFESLLETDLSWYEPYDL